MGRLCPWLVTVLALGGCTTPVAAPPARVDTGAVAQLPASAPPVAARAPATATLALARADEHGQPLPLRAVVHRDEGFGYDGEQVAVHDGLAPAVIRGLTPGRYRVLVLARPGPFGFDVVVGPDRPLAQVYVISGGQGHAVAVETRRERVGPGTTRVDRQILGFGWGPILDLHGEDEVDAAAVFQATADRVSEALAADPPTSDATTSVAAKPARP